MPGLFPRASLSSLKPIEKTVYLYLTAVGRRSPPELAAELGLARRRVQEALDGLEAAGLVEALTVSPLPGAPGGRAQRVYASREEK